MKRHVLVAVPLIGFWLTSGIARFAFALGQSDSIDNDTKFTFKPINGSSVISFNVEFMRNTFAKLALQDLTVTDLWFIDSVEMPSANSMELLAIDADIVGGVYPIPNDPMARRGKPPVWSMYERQNGSFRSLQLPDKRQWLRCYFAEFGGQMEIAAAHAPACVNCNAQGTTTTIGSTGRPQKVKCSVCHGTRYTRLIRAR